MPESSLEQLIAAARLLRPLLDQLVFVGGSVTGLLLSEPGTGAGRPTLDVDAIADITSYAQYAAFGEQLRNLGFSEDTREQAPLCRWVHQDIVLDVMPMNEQVLGFSSRWYRTAIATALFRQLETDLNVRIVIAPLFIATKLEAFKSRGRCDLLTSRDMEDLISVVDGRPSLAAEVQSCPHDVRNYIRDEIHSLLRNPEFLEALPGFLLPDRATQSRIPAILHRLESLATG